MNVEAVQLNQFTEKVITQLVVLNSFKCLHLQKGSLESLKGFRLDTSIEFEPLSFA